MIGALVFLAVVAGIPISIALVRNHRHSVSNRYAHMRRWVPGNPDVGSSFGALDTAPSPNGTAGLRILGVEHTRFGKRALIAAGAPPLQQSAEPVMADALGGGAVAIMAEPAEPALLNSPEPRGRLGEACDAETGALLTSQAPEVRVMERVEVVGWREEPDRRNVTELAVFLALHAGRKVPGEEIRAALWRGDLETTAASIKSLHNAISKLRKCLGPEHVPEASKGSGYCSSAEVASDWGRFSELVDEAAAGGEDEVELLTKALHPVRGLPFEGTGLGSYSWAWTELFVARIEVVVASAAARLCELRLAREDPEGAQWAVLQGLSSAPYDRNLWSGLFSAAAMGGRPGSSGPSRTPRRCSVTMCTATTSWSKACGRMSRRDRLPNRHDRVYDQPAGATVEKVLGEAAMCSSTIVPATVGPLELEVGFTFVGDAELNGDEGLAIGRQVEVCDEAGCRFAAVVTDFRDRVWRLKLTSSSG